MADLGGTFDPGAIVDERQLLPECSALAQVFESDLVMKDERGNVVTDQRDAKKQRLTLGWEILDGPLQGRKMWTGLNIQNPNAQSQEIAQRDLKRICEAAGVGPIRNSDDLHFKPMTISIVVTPAKGEYGTSNDIKGYKFYGPPPRAPAVPVNPVNDAVRSETQNAPAPKPAAAGNVPWPTR